MPTPFWNCLRIILIAAEADWVSATALGGDVDGLGVSVPVFTESDPPTRNATHKMANGRLNAAQLADLQGRGVDLNGYVQFSGALAGCLVKLWDATPPATSPLSGMLSENGLTTNPD
jgi:hypothetical protein